MNNPVRVLILSATASAINYIQSLGNDPSVKLFVTDANPFAAGLYSSNVTPLLVPRARNTDEYRIRLEEIFSKYKIDVLLPTSDHDMEGIAKLKSMGWKPDVKMFDFDPNLFFQFTNKSSLSDMIREKGIRSIRDYKNSVPTEFPVVIKPNREGGSKDVWIVNSLTELQEKELRIKQKYGDNYIIQEYIPGGTGSIYVVLLLFGNDGKLYGQTVMNSTLTFMTWGGGGNAGIVVKNEDLIKKAISFLNIFGIWKGPINLEYKRHEQTGEFYLMEINCRLNGYSFLSTMNGLNFPKAIVELLTTEKTEMRSHVQQPSRNFVISYPDKVVDQWIGFI